MEQYIEYFDYMDKRINKLTEENKQLSERIELLEEYAISNDFEEDVQMLVIQLLITIISVVIIYALYILFKIYFCTHVPKYGEKYIDL